MKYKDKEYKTIIWDWKSTLYDPYNETLYDWVLPFLDKSDAQNYLVSWSNDVAKRTELIKSYNLEKYFKKIIISLTSKRENFEMLFEQEGVDPETTLVVGDNINDEIKTAREMSVDAIHISTFVQEVVKPKK